MNIEVYVCARIRAAVCLDLSILWTNPGRQTDTHTHKRTETHIHVPKCLAYPKWTEQKWEGDVISMLTEQSFRNSNPVWNRLNILNNM